MRRGSSISTATSRLAIDTMKTRYIFCALASTMLVTTYLFGDVAVLFERNQRGRETPQYGFEKVPAPSKSDAASKASFVIVDGRRDRNGGDIAKLHDGLLPTSRDDPAENFFFAAGTEGGRLLVDLGKAVQVEQVNTYSWHAATRGPQVYKLYASEGGREGFDARPGTGVDPLTCGWDLIASVDTRPDDREFGGQYGVSIRSSGGTLGEIRHLLFAISRTEAADPFGNTFFSEIDVVEQGSARVAATPYVPAGATPRCSPGRSPGAPLRLKQGGMLPRARPLRPRGLRDGRAAAGAQPARWPDGEGRDTGGDSRRRRWRE